MAQIHGTPGSGGGILPKPDTTNLSGRLQGKGVVISVRSNFD